MRNNIYFWKDTSGLKSDIERHRAEEKKFREKISELESAENPSEMDIKILEGLTIKEINGLEKGSENVEIKTEDGRIFEMKHFQDCCERVSIEDIAGDLDDLVGSPLVRAEERTSKDFDTGSDRDDSYLWTFYEFATVKGSVTIRWYGESNGYYSVSVDLEHVVNDGFSDGGKF